MLIAETIQEWIDDPTVLAEFNLDPPTAKALDVALALSAICPNFTRVVPDSDGGVVFTTIGMEAIHLGVDGDGSLDYTRWNGATMEMRMQWNMKEETNGEE